MLFFCVVAQDLRGFKTSTIVVYMTLNGKRCLTGWSTWVLLQLVAIQILGKIHCSLFIYCVCILRYELFENFKKKEFKDMYYKIKYSK